MSTNTFCFAASLNLNFTFFSLESLLKFLFGKPKTKKMSFFKSTNIQFSIWNYFLKSMQTVTILGQLKCLDPNNNFITYQGRVWGCRIECGHQNTHCHHVRLEWQYFCSWFLLLHIYHCNFPIHPTHNELEVRHRKDEVFFKSTKFYIWNNFLKKHANLKKSMWRAGMWLNLYGCQAVTILRQLKCLDPYNHFITYQGRVGGCRILCGHQNTHCHHVRLEWQYFCSWFLLHM